MAPGLDALLQAALRRLVTLSLEQRLAHGLRPVLALALLVALADKVWRLPADPWLPMLAVTLLTALLLTLGAWRHRPSTHAVALILDQRLGLQDRLSSAVALRETGYEGPLREPVLRTAERAAADLDLGRALPRRPSRAGRWSLGLAAALVVLAPLPPIPFAPAARRRAEEHGTRQAAQALAATAQSVEARAKQANAPQAAEEARRLAREAARLQRARLGQTEALRRLDELARAVRAKRDALAGRPLARTGREARRDLRALGELAGKLADGLEDASHTEAQELLRELAGAERAGRLSAPQAKKAADELARAADALSNTRYARQAEALRQAASALRDGGSQAGTAASLDAAAEAMAAGPGEGGNEQELLETLQEGVQAARDGAGGNGPSGGGRQGGDQAGEAGRGRGPGATNDAAHATPDKGGAQPKEEAGEAPPDKSVPPPEHVYAPRRTEAAMQNQRLKGRLAGSGAVRAELGPGEVPGGEARAKVPYQDVLPAYRAQADDALSRGEIPATERTRVKRYFDALNEPAGTGKR